jgi:hypothetical protein
MRHALDGGADPRETLERCANELTSERRYLIEKIEMLREWADDRPAS